MYFVPKEKKKRRICDSRLRAMLERRLESLIVVQLLLLQFDTSFVNWTPQNIHFSLIYPSASSCSCFTCGGGEQHEQMPFFQVLTLSSSTRHNYHSTYVACRELKSGCRIRGHCLIISLQHRQLTPEIRICVSIIEYQGIYKIIHF